jgi:hypothetical protein
MDLLNNVKDPNIANILPLWSSTLFPHLSLIFKYVLLLHISSHLNKQMCLKYVMVIIIGASHASRDLACQSTLVYLVEILVEFDVTYHYSEPITVFCGTDNIMRKTFPHIRTECGEYSAT